jgi:hypothetical protein
MFMEIQFNLMNSIPAARYVDVLNPGSGSNSGENSPVPTSLFNVLPTANTNMSASASSPAMFNPAGQCHLLLFFFFFF